MEASYYCNINESFFFLFFFSFFWHGALHYLGNVNGNVMFESIFVYFKHKPNIFNGRILEY